MVYQYWWDKQYGDKYAIRIDDDRVTGWHKLAPDEQVTTDTLPWIFYDTDRDGMFDVVLFTNTPRTGTATGAFRIEPKTGIVRNDASLVGSRLFRTSLFRDKAMQAQFRKIIPMLFDAHAVEG